MLAPGKNPINFALKNAFKTELKNKKSKCINGYDPGRRFGDLKPEQQTLTYPSKIPPLIKHGSRSQFSSQGLKQ